jgi:hypothetical protein
MMEWKEFTGSLAGGRPTDNERFRSITSALRHYSLTVREERFIDLVSQYWEQKGSLTDEQECILEGVYRETRRWAKLLI